MWKDRGLRTSVLWVLCCVCVGLGVVFLGMQGGMTILAARKNYAEGRRHDEADDAGETSRYSTILSNVTVSVGAGSCNCSVDVRRLMNYREAVMMRGGLIAVDCRCDQPASVEKSGPETRQQQQLNASCAPGRRGSSGSGQKKQNTIIKVEEPWYAKDKVWHYPVRFPRCTMDACFNYSRCDGADDLLIYIYDEPAAPARYFAGLNATKWHTRDPARACLFFVFLDTPGLYRPEKHPSTLPFWNHGLNHVLITFNDMWRGKGHAPETLENASVMISDMHLTTYRPGFDVSVPLPGFRHYPRLQGLKPFERKYLLTFRGLRYLNRNMTGEGVLRSHESFRGMHNGRDVIVATSCRHRINDEHRQEDPMLGAHCDDDEEAYGRYDYADLMNSTFGLAPAGIQPNSYRFAEILSAGAIPVLVTDNYVKPFEGLVQWHRCVLEFPSSEMHRIVPAVRSMRRRDAEKRQKYCLQIYRRMFSSSAALLKAAVEAQKVRFMSAFPSWTDLDYDELEF